VVPGEEADETEDYEDEHKDDSREDSVGGFDRLLVGRGFSVVRGAGWGLVLVRRLFGTHVGLLRSVLLFLALRVLVYRMLILGNGSQAC
jgi:hypothetical protein